VEPALNPGCSAGSLPGWKDRQPISGSNHRNSSRVSPGVRAREPCLTCCSSHEPGQQLRGCGGGCRASWKNEQSWSGAWDLEAGLTPDTQANSVEGRSWPGRPPQSACAVCPAQGPHGTGSSQAGRARTRGGVWPGGCQARVKSQSCSGVRPSKPPCSRTDGGWAGGEEPGPGGLSLPSRWLTPASARVRRGLCP